MKNILFINTNFNIIAYMLYKKIEKAKYLACH